MDYADLQPQLRELKSDLHQALQEKKKLDSHVEHLERAIEGIEGLIGPQAEPATLVLGETSADDAVSNGSPPLMGTPAIRKLLEESGDRIWRAKEIHAALDQRGWISPNAQHPLRGVEAAINRMWRTDELERVSPGRYRRAQPAAEGERE